MYPNINDEVQNTVFPYVYHARFTDSYYYIFTIFTMAGSITMEDVLTVAPFQNTIDIVELAGRHVRAMFEHSVHNYDQTALDPGGNFLQVSGK